MHKLLQPKCSASRIGEKGAAAVEFALILPILLMLVLGIFEFGRAFNIQVALSEAAREAARYAAVHYADAGYSDEDAQNAGVVAAPSVDLVADNVDVAHDAGACSPGDNVVVTVTFNTTYLTGLPGLIPGMPADVSLTGRGVMRCGG
ncbi:TadE/TadG family type IV pilus assembly protein [Arthrobacter sp. ISL-5]|uniref:TadE/TadG family type IV pilus assembly protein n=1 Tax=Arthrobacter sp. ISL-5 TaxID=2819111 RepID=UPI001BE53557|nr:TadE/TadG family type IV pilus assembly protein [Arthrobacter sp. ISL-5]MBT2552948.1 pilus assembly protein [Arthrobacter sp. ISL-5]